MSLALNMIHVLRFRFIFYAVHIFDDQCLLSFTKHPVPSKDHYSYETICLSCLYLIIFYRQVVDVPVHWNSQSFWIIKYPRQLTFVDSGTVWRGGRLGRVNGGGVRFPQLSHWPGTQPRNGAVLADPRLHPVCACQSDSGFKSRTCTSYWWSRDCYVTRFAYIWRTCS